MVFIAEWTEVLMSLAKNWNAADSSGEGLSHWCAITRFQQGHDNYYGSSIANWLDGTGSPNQGTILPNTARSDWVNTTYTGSTVSDGTFVHGDGDPVSYGCALAFIYYLNVQLGFEINQIIPVYNSNLASVYRALTGDKSNPFGGFLRLIETVYPASVSPTSINGSNRNNAFPIALVSFAGGKNTFGKDETKDILGTQGGYVANSFALYIEGFSKASFLSLGITVGSFTGSFFNTFVQANLIGPLFESGVNDTTPQRIEVPFDLQLTNDILTHFPDSGTATFDLSVSLNTSSSPVTGSHASIQFELIARADPYFANLNTNLNNLPWLSQDLRVFTVTPGVQSAPIPGVAAMTDSISGAYTYIQSLLTHLNSTTGGFTNPNGPDPFTTVLPSQSGADQADSSVTPYTLKIGGGFPPKFDVFNNYNFGVARVRLRGSSQSQASNVRVFFRLFITQTNDTDYDVDGTYRATPDAAGQPGSPLTGVGDSTIPFFATNNYSSQNDYNSGPNIQTITIPDHQDQVWAYYGCFINVYDAANSVDGKQVQSYLAGTHHCLVAQIAYDDAPIPQSVSPLSWDQLAQRNLQVTLSDNPGPASSHRIPQTFDTRPSQLILPPAGPNTIFPDELVIEWGTVPSGSIASIYWPQVHAGDVIALAKIYYITSPLSISDTNTIRIPITGGVSYVPIPDGTGDNFAGLITIELPVGIQRGQTFDVTVKRLSTRFGKERPKPPSLQTAAAFIIADGTPAEAPVQAAKAAPGQSKPSLPSPSTIRRTLQWRYVVGTFQIHIPVATGDEILPSELTMLAIMKWRLEQMSISNRWYPVLVRYIQYISDRVTGLGGDPSTVPPSLTYVPQLLPTAHHLEGDKVCGKVGEILFDCQGDFTGFVLNVCHETRLFHNRCASVREVVLRACRDGLKLCVWIDEKHEGRIHKLAIKA